MKYIKELLKKHKNVKINVDESGLAEGSSITEFMDSLKKNDLIVIIVTSEYLHSRNCMYEISKLVEVVEYQKKVFPVICDNQIYDTLKSVQIIGYWEEKERKVKEEFNKLKEVNTGFLSKELGIIQDIQRSLGRALPFLQDRNNTDIDGIERALNNKLDQLERLEKTAENENKQNTRGDFFSQTNLTVPQKIFNTDFEKNKFLSNAYSEIITAMNQMFSDLMKRREDIQVTKQNDGIYELYQNEKLLRHILVTDAQHAPFLGYITFSSEMFLTHDSCNEQYAAHYKDGRFVLRGMFSYSSTRDGYFYTANEVVADIWKRFISPCISDR